MGKKHPYTFGFPFLPRTTLVCLATSLPHSGFRRFAGHVYWLKTSVPTVLAIAFTIRVRPTRISDISFFWGVEKYVVLRPHRFPPYRNLAVGFSNLLRIWKRYVINGARDIPTLLLGGRPC